MKKKPKIFYKNIVIQIFRDHWKQFKIFHSELITSDIEENVEKMMGCGLLENGYFEYICPGCFKKRLVGFTCKSRFCLRCSKVYIDKWIARMKGLVFKWIKHRHIILTVPGSLWGYFRDSKMLQKLSECGVKTVKEVVKICNHGKELDLGIIRVLQTSGRASTWNPHLHMLVTEGGLNEKGDWQDFYWFEYMTLKKCWMYNLLEMVKEELGSDMEVLKKIDDLWVKRRDKGLIVRAKKEKVRRCDIVGYLIKYVASPPMALSRISGYDGRSVKYWYREHPTDKKVEVTVSVYEFIRRMIQHIMPKWFRAVEHYGLYARRKVKRVREILARIFEGVKEVVQEFKGLLGGLSVVRSYRERIKESFGRDPFFCRRCNLEMILYRIWHPKYGVVYDFVEDGCRDEEISEGGREQTEKEKPVEEQLCFAI